MCREYHYNRCAFLGIHIKFEYITQRVITAQSHQSVVFCHRRYTEKTHSIQSTNRYRNHALGLRYTLLLLTSLRRVKIEKSSRIISEYNTDITRIFRLDAKQFIVVSSYPRTQSNVMVVCCLYSATKLDHFSCRWLGLVD